MLPRMIAVFTLVASPKHMVISLILLTLICQRSATHFFMRTDTLLLLVVMALIFEHYTLIIQTYVMMYFILFFIM